MIYEMGIKFIYKTGVPIALIIMVCLISGSGKLNAQNIPALTKAGDGAIIKAELIYSLDNKPTPQCHASTIEEIGEGFITAWFGGTHEKNDDVGIWVSRNIDGHWLQPVEVVNGVQNESLRYPCWNPVLFQPADGPLMLFYKVGPSPSEWWGMLTTSKDGGETWSNPQKLGRSKHGDLLGPIKNKPVQLENGTLICPTSIEYENENDEDFWRVYFEISNDNGATWEVTDYINDGVVYDAIQPSILFYPDHKLQILCRSQQNVITQSWSNDSGKTWSPMTATSLPNPNAGTDAVTLKDGRQLLVYNHTNRGGDFPNGRNMLNVAISGDGISWLPVLTLERSEGEYSYPAVIQSSDGLVHITYTYQRQSVKYVVIDSKQIN